MDIAVSAIYVSFGVIADFWIVHENSLHKVYKDLMDSDVLPSGDVVIPTYM